MGAEISALADFLIIPPFEHEKSIEKAGDSIDYFLLTIDYFCENCREDAGNETTSFRPKAMVAPNKNEKR